MADRGPVLDIEQIGRLMALMEQHGINVVELRHGESRVRLRRGFPPVAAAAAPAVISAPMPAFAPLTAPPPSSAAAPATAAAGAAPAKPAEDGPHIASIKSPMVGTFYLRPKPDAEAFVKAGDRVEQDTVVCIIEAMKTFNEIPAGVSGVVVAVLAKNEEPVDYDRPLFRVDTSR